MPSAFVTTLQLLERGSRRWSIVAEVMATARDLDLGRRGWVAAEVIWLLDGSFVRRPAGGDETLARHIAGRQRTAIAREQLLAAGWTPSAVDHAVRSRRLRRLHDGVYLLEALVPPDGAEAAAALLAAGRVSRLFGLHALAHQGVGRRPVGPAEVVVPRGEGSRPQDVTVHRRRDLQPQDGWIRDGLPTTTPARALLDVAASTIADRDFDRLLSQAHFERAARAPDLRDVVERHPRHLGAPRIANRLARVGRIRTKSAIERDLFDLCDEAGFEPPPQPNHRVGRFEVDAYWADLDLAVEVDAEPSHGGVTQIVADRERDLRLEGCGTHVVRVWDEHLRERRLMVVASLATARERRRLELRLRRGEDQAA